LVGNEQQWIETTDGTAGAGEVVGGGIVGDAGCHVGGGRGWLPASFVLEGIDNQASRLSKDASGIGTFTD
jgi:hypothetical protein